jgi:ribonuclease HII
VIVGSSVERARQGALFTADLKKRMRLDAQLRRDGAKKLAGIDEAGRGPLAGPVVSAIASILPGTALPGLDDSKKLTERKREELFERLRTVRGRKVWYGIGQCSAQEVDELGIRPATFLSMERAVVDWLASGAQGLEDFLVVIDGRDQVPGLRHLRQIAVIKADGRSRNVAAASVLAKVSRDRIMVEMSRQYPEYGFERHKGYGTKAHMEALDRAGPSPVHRRSFEPVKTMVLSEST